ncbi:putative zinc-binding peptidase [Jatrophihabitans telluris]|uniref:Zinc-binding peptidase n=1 Tax=Jatrophihabitans telluris TaxID=2038343 RepID=A0ABY4QX08_9ACTN|nr:putative zinc-binding metallopeptidase [Jatrophihabitans telluris]UQX87474.1 putative zinc-binding peptidase [Jatrophihabitans telluris]
MRSFACPHCTALIFFQNSVCLNCSSPLGFIREQAAFVRLEPTSYGSLGAVDPDGHTRVVCANLGLTGCNWLAEPGAVDGFCSCCALTQTRPADDDTEGLAAYARTEKAKRRLVFQLDTLGLPTTPRSVDPDGGLAFDMLSSENAPVVTGHDSGLITIDLAEGDDPHREALRTSLGEPYRTLLGHLRHETGHWYFDVLVASDDARLSAFRELFGDERADYAQALQQHYGSERTDQWRPYHVSDYAASHPWEDWAETFAHYLHMTDTLETAYSYGVSVSGPRALEPTSPSTVPSLTSSPQPRYVDFDTLVNSWLSLTAALNAVNRSMGKDDLYPFVLVPTVIAKLRFVARMIGAPS